ncbi:MAG: TIGR03915 family putative DNA repair protein [Clostridia bacterium]|nr:TIGR03915 family putative DNA repair protein [Clostridia bacterium]
MRRIYQIDQTPCAFFTAVFSAYADKCEQSAAITSTAFQSAFGDEFISVYPDEKKAARVVKKLRAIDKNCLYELDCILRTPEPDKEQTAFLYIRRLIEKNAPVRGMLAFPEIRRAVDLSARVGTERHRLTGFLRFHETSSGIYYAACTPDNELIDLLMPHFCARFKNTPFVIHDVKREIAGVSDGKSWLLAPAKRADVVFSAREDGFLTLWTEYYRTVAIPERKNTRQMKNYMPVRYWAFMPEKQSDRI